MFFAHPPGAAVVPLAGALFVAELPLGHGHEEMVGAVAAGVEPHRLFQVQSFPRPELDPEPAARELQMGSNTHRLTPTSGADERRTAWAINAPTSTRTWIVSSAR